jgi:hypothetical protein
MGASARQDQPSGKRPWSFSIAVWTTLRLPSALACPQVTSKHTVLAGRRGARLRLRALEGAGYNPPVMPERPFEADYPQRDWPDGPPVDSQGRLTRDKDGRPLDQNSSIIGRNKVPGYGPKSEADRSLRDRIAVIPTLKKAGSSLERVPRSSDQTSGGWAPTFDAKGRFTGERAGCRSGSRSQGGESLQVNGHSKVADRPKRVAPGSVLDAERGQTSVRFQTSFAAPQL